LELAYTEQLRTARLHGRSPPPFCDAQGARTPAGDQWLAEQLAFALTRQLFREAPVCEFALVPYPTTLRRVGGSVDLPRNLLVIANDPRLTPCAEWLADSLARSTGFDTRVGSEGQNEFRIALDWQELEFQVEESTARRETYTLSINEHGARLGGGSAQALAHAGATLLQLFGDAQATRKDQSLLSLPYLRIYDQPAMEYRGLSLNLARRPVELTALERVIELCGYYKLRYLELELSDDQAFLFPSRAFPGLTAPGESFTREQWLGLAAFAHARGVELVPGLSLPNQAAQLIALRPDVFGGNPRLSSTIDLASPAALDAADELLLELCELFPNSRYVQLGSAACDRDALTASPHWVGGGAADADELIAKFFARASALLNKRGRRAIVRGGLNYPLSEKLPRELLVAVDDCQRDPLEALSAAGFEILHTAAGLDAHGWSPRAWPHSDPATDAACVLWGKAANLRGAQIPISVPEDSERMDALLSQIALLAERLWNPTLRTTQEAFSERRVRTERAFRRIAR
jgi:hypothetical protein